MQRTQSIRLIGPILILVSTIFYASHGVWSKALMPYFDALSSSWSRSLIVVALLLPLLLVRRSFVWPRNGEIWWLLAIIIPGSLVTPLYFYAFEHLSVGVATLVFFTCYTVGALVYGKLFFNEQLTQLKLAALLLGLIGLGLVSSPYFQPASIWAVLGCAFAGLCGAAEITFTKKLPNRYSEYYITFLIYAVTGASTLGLALMIGGSSMTLPATVLPWLLSLGYAGAIIVAIVLVIRGFKTTEPSIGGIIGLMEIVFGVLFGVVFFQEQVSLVVFVGVVLIFIAGLLPSLRLSERRQSMPYNKK